MKQIVLDFLSFVGKPLYFLLFFLTRIILVLFYSPPAKLRKRKFKLAKFVTVPKIETDGVLIQMQFPEIPFDIKRVYFIYGVSIGAARGAHTHKETSQVLFCIRGNIQINLDNGMERESVILDKPNIGVLLEPGVWHEMEDFKKDTILLVLASKRHEELDYVRSYEDFLRSYAKG